MEIGAFEEDWLAKKFTVVRHPYRSIKCSRRARDNASSEGCETHGHLANADVAWKCEVGGHATPCHPCDGSFILSPRDYPTNRYAVACEAYLIYYGEMYKFKIDQFWMKTFIIFRFIEFESNWLTTRLFRHKNAATAD